MSRLIVIFLALTTFGAMASPPKVAIVRIQDVYRVLPSTKSDQAAIEAMRAEILKDSRAEQWRKLIGELQALHAEILRQNDTAGADTALRDKLTREYEIKRSSAQSLQQDFEAFRTEKTAEINRKMVERMRASLDRIAAAAQKLGVDKGFDWVLDSSGSTNTGLPFVLYAKDAKDLTDDLTAALSEAPVNTAGAKPASPVAPPHKP